MNDLQNFIIIQHYYTKVSLLKKNTVKDKHIDRYDLHLPLTVQSQKAHHSTLCCKFGTRMYFKWFSWTQQKAHRG
jgi:hypothetical protein